MDYQEKRLLISMGFIIENLNKINRQAVENAFIISAKTLRKDIPH